MAKSLRQSFVANQNNFNNIQNHTVGLASKNQNYSSVDEQIQLQSFQKMMMNGVNINENQ